MKLAASAPLRAQVSIPCVCAQMATSVSTAVVPQRHLEQHCRLRRRRLVVSIADGDGDCPCVRARARHTSDGDGV